MDCAKFEQPDQLNERCKKCGIVESEHREVISFKRTLSNPDIIKRISMISIQQDKLEIMATLTERVRSKIGKG